MQFESEEDRELELSLIQERLRDMQRNLAGLVARLDAYCAAPRTPMPRHKGHIPDMESAWAEAVKEEDVSCDPSLPVETEMTARVLHEPQ